MTIKSTAKWGFVVAAGSVLLASGCRDRTKASHETAPPVTPERSLAEGDPSATAKLERGARQLGRGTQDLLSDLGARVQEAGTEIEAKTRNEREAFAKRTRETVDEIRDWLESDVVDPTKEGGARLRQEASQLASAIDDKLDRLGDESKEAAGKVRHEVAQDLAQLRNKLEQMTTSEP